MHSFRVGRKGANNWSIPANTLRSLSPLIDLHTMSGMLVLLYDAHDYYYFLCLTVLCIFWHDTQMTDDAHSNELERAMDMHNKTLTHTHARALSYCTKTTLLGPCLVLVHTNMGLGKRKYRRFAFLKLESFAVNLSSLLPNKHFINMIKF